METVKIPPIAKRLFDASISSFFFGDNHRNALQKHIVHILIFGFQLGRNHFALFPYILLSVCLFCDFYLLSFTFFFRVCLFALFSHSFGFESKFRNLFPPNIEGWKIYCRPLFRMCVNNWFLANRPRRFFFFLGFICCCCFAFVSFNHNKIHRLLDFVLFCFVSSAKFWICYESHLSSVPIQVIRDTWVFFSFFGNMNKLPGKGTKWTLYAVHWLKHCLRSHTELCAQMWQNHH